jgi:uncharacterized protein (DUF433 family)
VSTILERPLYSIGEASRLLAIDSRKLHRWLEGGSVAGRPYPPVIRTESTGSDEVTWAEFIEAGFLREYRARQVSLQQLRAVIDQLRSETGVKYPLAFHRPLVLSKELVLKMTFPEDLGKERLVVHRGPSWQTLWAEAVSVFLDKVDFDAEGLPLRLRPLGKESPLAIDPDVAFGIPQVGGIRTEVIAEAFAAGDDEEAIAESWSIGLDDVKAALRWELKKAA